MTLTNREVVEAACRGIVWYDHGFDGPDLGDSRIELCCILKNGEMKIIHAASLDAAYEIAELMVLSYPETEEEKEARREEMMREENS